MKIDIKKFLDENEEIINEIYYSREDKIAEKVKTNVEYNKELDEKSNKFEMALDNLPPYFVNTKALILATFEEYIETTNYMNSYLNEAYYKNGFIDGVKLIIELMK